MGKVDDLIMEVHRDAYAAVMKSFSLGELSWTKDGVLTTLRKELGLTGEDHDNIKGLVMEDDYITALREGRVPPGGANKKARYEVPMMAASKPAKAPVAMPPKAATQKKMHPGTSGKPAQAGMQGAPPVKGINEHVGKRVKRLWEGHWHDCAITDYNAQTNEHCFVYHYGTTKEAWDWSNLHKLVADDQVQMMGGPKLDLLAPAASQLHMFAPQPMYVEQPLANKGPQGHKKGAKGAGAGRGGGVAKPRQIGVQQLDSQLDKVKSKGAMENFKNELATREQDLLAQLSQLNDSDDSDA